MPLPLSQNFGYTAVSCSSRTFCLVSGRGFSTFDGKSWTKPTSLPTPPSPIGDPPGIGGFDSVSCPVANFCAQVDIDGYAVTYTGGRVTATPVDSGLVSQGAELNGVTACVSRTLCVALDNLGGVLNYQNGRWILRKVSQLPQLQRLSYTTGSLSCRTTTFCMALDLNGNSYLYDGNRWVAGPAVFSDLQHEQLGTSVSCTSTTFCLAVSDTGEYSTFDGRSWSPIRSFNKPINLSTGPQSVSCGSSNFCVAVDAAGNAFTYDGVTWHEHEAVDPSAGFTSVSCPTSGFCVAIDGDNAFSYS